MKKWNKKNTNLFPSEQGRMIYWHIGNRRKANAIVAITGGGETQLIKMSDTMVWYPLKKFKTKNYTAIKLFNKAKFF